MRRRRRSQPRTSELRKHVASPDDDWYTIKSILDERSVEGRVEYLVDWNDDETTGEAYSPTWSREVTDEAKEEWAQIKALRVKELIQQRSQDSQPPRPSNWRQQQRHSTAGLSDLGQRRRQGSSPSKRRGRPRKIKRVSYCATPSKKPTPSIASLSSAESILYGTSDVAKNDYLTLQKLDALRSQKLVIEFQRKSQFDPSEFSSQHQVESSGLSSQSIVELEDRDERLAFASQLSHRTIPDSQESSGQTWLVDLPQIEVVSPVQLLETQHTSQLDSYHSSSSLQRGGIDGSSGIVCDRKAAGKFTEQQSHALEIPSHQLGQTKSFSVSSQDLHLTTTGTKPLSVANSPPGNRNLAGAAASTSPPLFLSQPPLPFTFDVSESSTIQSQRSSTRSILNETPSREIQDYSRAPLTAEYLTEFQDAQVLHINTVLSYVEAFTDSHDTGKYGGSALAYTSTLSRASVTGPQPFLESLKLSMEHQAAREPSYSASQPPAVDELSQILDLDRVIGDSQSSLQREPLNEGNNGLPTLQSSGINVQESKADCHTTEPIIMESEHGQAKLPSEPQTPALQSLQGIVNTMVDDSDLPVSTTIIPDALHNRKTSTVALADISNQQRQEGAVLTLIPSLLSHPESHDDVPQTEFQSSAISIPVGQPQADEKTNDDISNVSSEPNISKHIITLPFQASMRPLYDDTLLEFKMEVTQFGAIFNSTEYSEPDEALVYKIDQVLDQLHNICDYPPDAVGTALQDLPSGQLMKYCCDGNSKFNFLYELFRGLNKKTRTLIVARSIELLKLLYRLTEVIDIECICDDLRRAASAESPNSMARVTLVLPSKDVDVDEYDLVVGYDHLFGSSVIGKKLEQKIPDVKSPLVLMLVTTHSIEHIDLYIPDELPYLERKNALISGIARARQFVGDPDPGYPEPYELANLFSDYLNGLVEDIVWEPISVPEEVLDVYVDSQPRSGLPLTGTSNIENARKRKLDDPDDEEAKRIRLSPFKQCTVQRSDVPVPDDVQMLLNSVKLEEIAAKSTGIVSVPVAVLQALAEQVTELRRQAEAADKDAGYRSLIAVMETRIKEYERTGAKMYSSQRRALGDRFQFERQAQKAEVALQSATETAQREAEKAQKRIADLEETVARLTSGQNGPGEETPLGKTQSLLQEAQERTRMLEKRLENAHKDADYARSLYQDATATSSALRGENADLKEQVTDLRRRTEDTLGKVHAIQAESTTRQYLHQIRVLKSQLHEREIELDCAKDELRQLKNGRRETRQVSVPRSPRMGMMSPRAGRAMYGTGGGGGSASRGTSPALTSVADGAAPTVLGGMQFMAQTPGNERWNHLRD